MGASLVADGHHRREPSTPVRRQNGMRANRRSRVAVRLTALCLLLAGLLSVGAVAHHVSEPGRPGVVAGWHPHAAIVTVNRVLSDVATELSPGSDGLAVEAVALSAVVGLLLLLAGVTRPAPRRVVATRSGRGPPRRH